MGKKFWYMVVACFVITSGYVIGYWYPDVKSWSKDIFHTIWTLIIAQGGADWGKEAKKVEVQAKCEDKKS